MIRPGDQSDINLIRNHAHPLTGARTDLDPLIERIGDAPFVLLGEATHGTHEFYHLRAAITRRLIEEKGFTGVAAEADWPDAYRVNRYVRGLSTDQTAQEALADFERFPRWMWRNREVVSFLNWLRRHNAEREPIERTGFYGLDLYSLYQSIEAVLQYLDRVDPDAAQRARQRYGCFEHTAPDPQRYGHAAAIAAQRSCEDEAVQQLIELRDRARDYLSRDGLVAEDEQFFAEQNARLIRNAEEYYRAMFGHRRNTWNLRDRHMADTLAALADHFGGRGEPAKLVVWAHNSHVGDARATEMSRRDELNIGQLARQRYGDEAVLVGFTTYDGRVAAASDWDHPVEHKTVRPALEGSHEALLHEVGLDRFLLLPEDESVREVLAEPRLERAIGVVYHPQSERISHYFDADLAEQFDAIIHIDHTHAVRPLDRVAGWPEAELPETYPFGV